MIIALIRQKGKGVLKDQAGGAYFACWAEGLFRVFGGEEYIRFEKHPARYVKLEILSTCGAASERAQYKDVKIAIGELTLFGKEQ